MELDIVMLNVLMISNGLKENQTQLNGFQTLRIKTAELADTDHAVLS